MLFIYQIIKMMDTVCRCISAQLEGRHLFELLFPMLLLRVHLGTKSGSTAAQMNENRTENEPLFCETPKKNLFSSSVAIPS